MPQAAEDVELEFVDARRPQRPRRTGLARVPATLWGLIMLGVGMALGSVFPDQLLFIGEGVKNAFGLISDAAPYIIFFTLTAAILNLLRTGSAAKFASWVLMGMVVSTLSAGLFGILVAIPVLSMPLGVANTTFLGVLGEIGRQTVTLAATSEPFIAIWYGALVALGLHYGSRVDATAWFCRPTGDTIRWVGIDLVELLGKAIKVAFPAILLCIGIFVPTSAAGAVADAQAELGGMALYQVWGSTNPVVWYLFTVATVAVAGIAWLMLVGYVICRYTGFSFRRFVGEYFAYIYPFAWATASSTASIPMNLERTDEALDARSEVRDFIVPLGATVNLDGTMMAAFLLIPIAGYLLGYQVTVMELFLVLIPLTIVSVGVPGIPGGLAVIAPPVVLTFIPIPDPAAFIAIFFAFGVGLTDQFRTGVNTVDNGLMCLLFEHWYPTKFALDGSPEAAGAPDGAPDAAGAGDGEAHLEAPASK